MGTNETLRFERAIKAQIRLKLVESKLAIQTGDWVQRDKAFAAALAVKHDVGDTLNPPESIGRTPPYFPPSEWESEEQERANAEIDREREEFLARCDAFDRIGERISFPALPDRPTLDAELAEVDARLAEDPSNVTLRGLRAHVIERQRTLARRVDATLPREWCVLIVAAVNAEVEKLTGIKQTATMPDIEPDTGFIRRMGCREG